MIDIKIPEIRNINDITPETFREYVRFVANMRHNQRRWFGSHNYSALEIARKMEEAIDKINTELLDINPQLF